MCMRLVRLDGANITEKPSYWAGGNGAHLYLYRQANKAFFFFFNSKLITKIAYQKDDSNIRHSVSYWRIVLENEVRGTGLSRIVLSSTIIITHVWLFKIRF